MIGNDQANLLRRRIERIASKVNELFIEQAREIVFDGFRFFKREVGLVLIGVEGNDKYPFPFDHDSIASQLGRERGRNIAEG